MSLFNPTLKEYKEAVEWHAKNSENNMLHNEGNDHALIIFENLYKYSKEYIRLFAKDLANKEVVNTQRYVDAVRAFINRPNIKFDILLTGFNDAVKDIDKGINFFYMISQSNAYKEGRIRIRDTKGMSFRIQGNPIHFCTADGHAYRVERNIEKRIAHGNFGDKETTHSLESKFDKAFEKCVNEVKLENYFS